MLLRIKQDSIHFLPMNFNKTALYNKRLYDVVSTSKNALSLSIQWTRWHVISIVALTVMSTLVVAWTVYHYRHGDKLINNRKLNNQDEKLNHPPKEIINNPAQNVEKVVITDNIELAKYHFSTIDFKELPYKNILANAKYKEHAVPVLIHLLAMTQFNKEKLPEIDLFLAKTEIDRDNFSSESSIIYEYAKKWLQHEGIQEDFDKKLLDRVGKIAFHGTSEAHLPGISENGLSPTKRVFDVSVLEKISSIFRKQKISFLAFNNRGIGGHNDNERICVTGITHNAVRYAIRSPEWFREAVGVQDLKKMNIPQMIANFKKKMDLLTDLTDDDKKMMLDFIETEANKYVDQRPAVIVVKDAIKNFSYLEKMHRIPKFSMPMEAMIVSQYKTGLSRDDQMTQDLTAHLSKDVNIERVILI